MNSPLIHHSYISQKMTNKEKVFFLIIGLCFNDHGAGVSLLPTVHARRHRRLPPPHHRSADDVIVVVVGVPTSLCVGGPTLGPRPWQLRCQYESYSCPLFGISNRLLHCPLRIIIIAATSAGPSSTTTTTTL